MERSKKIRNVPNVLREVSLATRTLWAMLEAPHLSEIKMQLLRESLRLSFLIAWIRKNAIWQMLYQLTKNSSFSRRSGC